MKTKKLEQTAKEMLKNHPNLEVIFLTEDGQGFSKRSDADSHSQSIRSEKIHEFKREEEVVSLNANDTNPKREELVTTFTELFGKAPAHNMKVNTLQNKIAEKQQEFSEQLSKDNKDNKTANSDKEE